MSTRSDEYPVTAVYLPRKIFRIKEACSNKAALLNTSHAGGTGQVTPAGGPAMKHQDQEGLQQFKGTCRPPAVPQVWVSDACNGEVRPAQECWQQS